MKELKHLSFSSIALLASDQRKWFLKYIMDALPEQDDFRSYVVGKAVHKVIEGYNKLGDIEYEPGLEIISKSTLSGEDTEIATMEFIFGCDNYFHNNPKRVEGEKEVIANLGHWIPYKGIIDGWDEEENEIIDYKVVKSFLDPENDFRGMYNKYKWQARFYALAMKICFQKDVKKVVFREILKGDCAIKENTKIAKENLISYCIGFQNGDEKLTMKKIVEKYRPRKPSTKDILVEINEAELQKAEALFENSLRTITMIRGMSEADLLSPLTEME